MKQFVYGEQGHPWVPGWVFKRHPGLLGLLQELERQGIDSADELQRRLVPPMHPTARHDEMPKLTGHKQLVLVIEDIAESEQEHALNFWSAEVSGVASNMSIGELQIQELLG